MKSVLLTTTYSLLTGCGLAVVIFAISLVPVGPRKLGAVENIHGIPYPKDSNAIVITEELAHADIYLMEPVLAKQLELTITYRPVNLTSLAVGVREDSFWLSYGGKQGIYPTPTLISPSREGEKKEGVITTSLSIPLTDKLQETDHSLDLMFFAESDDEVRWELHNVNAKVSYAWPTYQQFRNYVGSIIKRERAL
jgi:hypothetical protein